MSQRTLTAWQRHRLQHQLTRTQDVSLYRRTLAVLEFDRGRAAADIAKMLGVTRQSVYNWVGVYRQTGDPCALEADPIGGRPRLVDEDAEHLPQTLPRGSPQNRGFPHANWTVPLLQHVLELGTGQRLSDDTIRRALSRLDYVWKRPRYVLEPDPELNAKNVVSAGR